MREREEGRERKGEKDGECGKKGRNFMDREGEGGVCGEEEIRGVWR